MNVLRLEGLMKHSGLVHGMSPRFCRFPDGGQGVLSFRRDSAGRLSRRDRDCFLRALDIEKDEIFLVRQVHGDRVYILDDSSISHVRVEAEEADAIVTSLTDRPMAVMTADCIPIIVYDFQKHVVGVIHAGRKGTAKKILSKTIEVLKNELRCRSDSICVSMGPGIGGCCYEVDEPCIHSFMENFPGWGHFVHDKGNGKYMLDLYKANAEDAESENIPPQNIFLSRHCTFCEPDRFFSYRREGDTGRMLTLAMLLP